MKFAGITDEIEGRQRIEEFVKIFGVTKIDNDTFDIPTNYLTNIKNAKSLLIAGMEWRCECGVVNNAKNGEKCLKCNFTYRDWVFKQHEEYLKNQTIKYQPVTDRETACFLFGKFTSMITNQMPHADNLEMRVQTANIAGSITFDFIKVMEKHFTGLRDEEVLDVIHQLGNPENAILFNKFVQLLEDSIKSMFRE